MQVEAPLDTDRPDGESLTTVIREKIERMILSGDIPAGQRLNENALASELNVSRGPIREATRSLENAGLVEIVRNRGVFVRQISLEDALHLYDVRAGLARVAGRLLAGRATSEEIAALQETHEKMEQAREAQDQPAYNQGNRLFHSQLVTFAGNPRLTNYHETTNKELRLFVRRGVLGPARLRISNREHEAILDAVVQGDAGAAADAFERHILNGKQRMLDSLT
jgi:DNA-binding GntR family transcriptional regulator